MIFDLEVFDRLGRPRIDWATEEDYDPPGAEWVDATVVGGPERQVDVNAIRHRHRYRFGPWIKGLPKEDKDAEK